MSRGPSGRKQVICRFNTRKHGLVPLECIGYLIAELLLNLSLPSLVFLLLPCHENSRSLESVLLLLPHPNHQSRPVGGGFPNKRVSPQLVASFRYRLTDSLCCRGCSCCWLTFVCRNSSRRKSKWLSRKPIAFSLPSETLALLDYWKIIDIRLTEAVFFLEPSILQLVSLVSIA